MRQLLGKTSYRGVTEEVYLSETVRCQDCRITVPMGIEVVKREAKSKKLIKHSWYCRTHGAEYATRVLG